MDIRAIASSISPAPAPAVASPSAVARTPAQPPPAAAPTLGEVTDAVNAINRSMTTQSRGIEFSIDTDSHRTIVKVVDFDTRELIRQIPTVETLEIAHALDQWKGLLIKQHA
jgi:flagellar protein FlaG